MQHKRKKPNSYSSEVLKLITCPLCDKPYRPLQARVLEERDDAHLVHIQCRACGSAIVAVITHSGFGITSIGLVTDLTSEEVLQFKDSGLIAADEVLEIHAQLYPTRKV